MQDRGSARADLKDDRKTQSILSAVFIGGYFALMIAVLAMTSAGWMDKLAGEILGVFVTLVGVLTGEVPRIMAFWFGSSMGSKNKDAAMAAAAIKKV